MQRMMCISVEQYNRMVESYEGVMEELQELRELLQMPQGDVDEVAPAQPGHRAAEDKKGMSWGTGNRRQSNRCKGKTQDTWG